MSWYRTGTISVNNGASAITGVGTLFVSNIKEGYALLAPDLSVYEVANISSDTSFDIVGTYRGSNVTGGVYAIFQTQGYVRDLLNQVTDLLNTFGAFRDAYNNGDLVGTGLELKGILNSPADLPPSPAEGDAYLIGTSIYVYTTGDGWKNSNIAGVIPRGVWSAGTAYAYNDLVTYQGAQWRRIVAGTSAGNPATDTTNWAIFVSKGDTGDTGPAGVNPRGVWNALTAYAVSDLVTYFGSTWRRIVAGTTATPPDVDTTNWAVFAAKGVDGTGAVSTVNSIGPDLSGNVVISTTDIAEGSNQYFTAQRVRDSVLTGLSTATNSAIVAADSVLVALGKLQAQVSAVITTASNALAKAGGTMTGLLKFASGSNIASASTVNLSTATGNTVHITGTTAITTFTMSAGQIMDVIFDGILTLTHNATSNNLPGGASITTAAGDRARYYYDGTTVYCLNYAPQVLGPIAQVVHMVHQTDGSTNGGAASIGINLRPLATVKRNTIVGATTDTTNSRITVPTGLYRVTGWGTVYAVNNSVTYVRNLTTSTTVCSGNAVYTDNTTASTSVASYFDEIISLSATTTLDLVSYCGVGKSANGLGTTSGTSVINSIHASLRLEKIS